ncbi:M16 family metallopeptidase [Psychromonas sp. KJ10-10]|uniref:M16 family metallopeptidase n=1 Tax=Psychromonas sp. KJ10-10 TaxID=3391823 RepID=UPI0039B5F417
MKLQKYQQRFANATDFTFTFVGNIDLKEMEELVTTYIASLPSSDKQSPEQKLHVGKHNKGHIEVHLKNGLDQKAFVLLENSGETTWSNKNKILFEMVKSTLNVLLRNKIREQLGGTYNISVKGKLNNQPEQEYILSTQFFCEPERVDELVNAVQNELQRIKLEGINQKLLDNFKKQQSIARKHMLSNNKYWLYKLSKLDEESMFDLNNKLYNKTLAEITVAQVNQAMNAYLNSTNSVYATLLPENSPVLLATKLKQTK